MNHVLPIDNRIRNQLSKTKNYPCGHKCQSRECTLQEDNKLIRTKRMENK